MHLQPDQAKFLLDCLLPRVEAEHKTTLKVLRAMPSEHLDYRPDPRSMNAMDLAWHLASADVFFATAVGNGAFPQGGGRPEEVATPAQIADWFESAFGQALEKLRGVSGEQLLQKIKFHTFDESGLTYLELMLGHSIHHRGQLSTYLRPMGGKVPSIYGGSADEPARAESQQEAHA